MVYDLAVIGGGASGLAAAIEAANDGIQVIILEKLPRVGKKILATGNGRCNFTHVPIKRDAFHGEVVLAEEILNQFPDIIEWFEALGVLAKADAEGRVYPRSNMAASVLDALRFACLNKNVEILSDWTVQQIRKKRSVFLLQNQKNEYVTAKKIIIASGGAASPSMGSAGDVVRLLKPYHISMVPFQPALCPLPSDEKKLKSLKGIRIHATVDAVKNGRILRKEEGEVQFQEHAVSGICVFNLAQLSPEVLHINLLPEFSQKQVINLLRNLKDSRLCQPASDLMSGFLPKRVGEVLLRELNLSINEPIAGISEDQLNQIAKLLQSWSFIVQKPSDFSQAQVSSGGVPFSELSRHLELKKLPGCYVCGEAVHIHADCGGYNLSWAWASGRMAGRSAALPE